MENKKTVYLSPSVQDWNIGVGDYGTEEKRMNEIANFLEKKLLDSGKYEVIRNNPTMNLSEVIADSNRVNPDIHVAIHSNAGIGNSKGPEIYYYTTSTNGKKLATDIYNNILNIYPDKSFARGIKPTTELRELRETKAPATLLEVAFHDNLEDSLWIMQNEEKITNAIYKGIEEYFN